MDPNQQARQAVDKLRSFARAANRDPAEIGIEPRLNLREVDSRARRSYVADWRELGATHLSVSTLGMGHTSPQGHIEAIERAWVEIGLEDFQASGSRG
jgi:hypothetical protein